jgi:uncharacterized protein (DUF2252 family)
MLTSAERIAHGIAARKQCPRSRHCDIVSKSASHDPLALLHDSEKDRIQSLVAIKHQRMAASAFGFFRGAVPIMAADLATQPNTGLITQLCGDAHLSNLGAFAALDGDLTFDINDFDEAIRGPFEYDVKRLATSILLGGREAGIKLSDRKKAVLHFTAQYRRLMQRFAAMPVVDLARYQIHRLAHIAPIPAILAQSKRSTAAKTLASLTETTSNHITKQELQASTKTTHQELKASMKATNQVPQSFTASARSAVTNQVLQSFTASAHSAATNQIPQGFSLGSPIPSKKKGVLTPASPRHFKSDPPTLTRVTGKDRDLILASLGPYSRTLQPERRHFLAQYTPIDVAFKVVGTGSVGLRNYIVYFEGTHSTASDPLFLQIKEEPASAYATYLPEGSQHTHQGHRVMDGQRAMQLTSDPFLGYTTIDSRDYLVRQLNDHKASLDLDSLTGSSLFGYADLCGELFARGHARAGDPVAIAAYLGNSDRFDRAILDFATSYADRTEKYWATFKKEVAPHKPSKRKA